jgi:dTDP-4-dehydrorhamnose reductase
VKILVTGKNGQLGCELTQALAPLGEVMAVDRSTCDLADLSSVRNVIRTLRPGIIVNAAAYTAVDRAESDAAAAFQVNGHALGVIGEEARRLGALAIHFSTDYVFDGLKSGAYVETDQPNPLSVYGCSKLLGEQALASAAGQYLTFRTSWVLSAHGANFAKTMLRLAAERDTLSVVADQWGAPTSAGLLADMTAQVLGQYMNSKDLQAGSPSGVYHLAASGETNWCDYARFVMREALAQGYVLRAKPDDVKPISSDQYVTTAKRPSNSRLCTTKFTDTFKLQLPTWEDGVRHTLRNIRLGSKIDA